MRYHVGMTTSQKGMEPTPAVTTRRAPRKADPKAADPATKAAPFAHLEQSATALKGLKDRLARARAKHEDEIAELVSDKPGAVDWYDHPGVLTRDEVKAAAGIKHTVALHRIMDNYRKRLAKRPARERKSKGLI